MHILFILKEIDNEPHGVLYLSSTLKKADHRVSMVVATEEDPVEAALRLKPDLVGYSVYTGTQRYYLELNRRIRAQLPVFSIFGGPHPTFFPEMIEEEGVDGLCRGEGEYATLDLLNALGAHEPFERIPNWWFKIEGRIIKNPLRPLIKDLDQLPFPDRELLYQARPASRENKVKPFITGRGCPYNCTFCFNKAYSDLYKGASLRTRRRSVDNVIAEIEEVRKRHPLQFITFMDDTFILNIRWLLEFAEKYKAQIGLPFWCQVRADLVTEERIALFKDAGCVSVSFGLEAADDYMRNVVLNRNMSKEDILKASRILRGQGITFMTNNMLGLPKGGLAEDLETLKLNLRCRPSYANVFLYQPYPKTELGEMAFREGLMEGTFDDLSGSVSDNTVIKFKSALEKQQIENLQKILAIVVEFPFLLPLVKPLIRLPRNRLYWIIYKIWKGYALKNRMYPHKLTPKEYIRALIQYMYIRSQ